MIQDLPADKEVGLRIDAGICLFLFNFADFAEVFRDFRHMFHGQNIVILGLFDVLFDVVDNGL